MDLAIERDIVARTWSRIGIAGDGMDEMRTMGEDGIEEMRAMR